LYFKSLETFAAKGIVSREFNQNYFLPFAGIAKLEKRNGRSVVKNTVLRL
jgi:hypothetical protein